MFFLRTVRQNTKRHGVKSLITILICTLVVLFLCLYIGNITANRNQLSRLPEVIPVSARISNTAGSQTVGLLINGSLLEKVKTSDAVKDLRYTSRLAANIAPETPEQEDGYKEIAVTGVNKLSAFPILSEDDIRFMDGISPDFLQGHEANVIVRDIFYRDHHLSYGDQIILSMYSFDYGEIINTTNYKKIADIELVVVGSFAPPAQSGDIVMPDIICPVGWVEDTLSKSGVTFYADSAAFIASDPLHLNDFKAAMKEFGLLSADPQADPSSLGGHSLIVNDETFIRSAGSLKKNLTLMYAFFPLILIIVILVGYTASYLLVQSRRQEFAVMRSLGASQKSCEAMLSLENAILVLLGCLTGAFIAVLITGIGMLEGVVIAAVFLISYLSGAFFAVKLLGKFSVMEALAKSE